MNPYKYLTVIIFLLIWEAASRLELVNPLFIPPLTEVIKTTWEMAVSGILFEHAGISLFRALTGFLISLAVGIPLGLLLGGWFRKLRLALGSLLEVFSQTNPFILFHIVMLFLGIGEAPKVTIIAWTCTWPVTFSTISGIQNVNTSVMKAARGFGLGRVELFYRIVLPAAAPAIFTGIRLSLGYSFFMLIAAEMMASNSGLGWLIIVSQENYDILKIFSAAAVIAFLGLATDALMDAVEKKFIPAGVEEVLNSEH